MMRRFPLPLVVAAFAVLLALPASALATPQAVLKDFGPDGVIDGNHSLSDLQAADRLVTPEEREYQFWDDALAAAIDRLSNPDAPLPPPTVAPKDDNGNGAIDAAEVADAKVKTTKLRNRKKAAVTKGSTKTPEATEPDDEGDDGDDDEQGALAAGRDSGGDDSGGGPGWLLALLAVPVAIVAFGAVRLQRGRAKRAVPARAGVSGGGGPTSFAGGPPIDAAPAKRAKGSKAARAPKPAKRPAADDRAARQSRRDKRRRNSRDDFDGGSSSSYADGNDIS